MSDRTFQFGAYEVDQRSGELRKHGVKIRIQEQPFQILVLLLDRPGEIVGREEIRGKLWPENTFVDFDNAISSAVRKLREALSDSADNPRFIETLAKRGYRFIGPIETRLPAPLAVPKRTRIRVVPIAAGMLLILGIAAWWLWPRPKPAAVQSTPLPLTAARGWERNPSFSPDGSQVAYAWDETGTGNNSHIYIKLVGSGRPVQLTQDAKPDVVPSWSLDGRSIAFVRVLDQGSAIYLIPPVGGTERKLAEGYFYGSIHWSPDGRFLAVADRKSANKPPSLYRMDAENGEELRLTTPPGASSTDADPVFSPDGRKLLFARCGGAYTCGLYLLDLSAGYRPSAEPRLLREGPGPISGAAWTADAKEAIYAFSDRGDIWSFRLMKIRVEPGAKPERMTYAAESISGPAIAPRGDRLAYTQNSEDIDIWQIQTGKPPRSFASSTRIDFSPQYSPDGKRVAFSSSRSGQMEVWVSNAEGGNLVQLTSSAEHSGTPRWSPDGRWIAFDRHLNDGWHIFVMASDGGHARQLTFDAADQVMPSWSRDGSSIYYASNRTGRFEVWKTPAKGGQGTQVTRSGGWTAFESPDGHSLYYTKNLDNNDGFSGLWQLPGSHGEERQVLESVGSRAFAV
ncbi:MAG TPA: winged helix-turn-helix domain-containing protein, partial [Terriglobales bacterium]|nr:winged helix-turn-helix domain-containing protein [Terriglobales bacterium]